MTPDRWQQIEEVFHAALEVDRSERSSFLEARTDGDDELRAEVDKLISQFEDASSFIEQPVYEGAKSGFLSALLDETDDDPMVDKLLGSHRIEREIGRGGMGAVYEAVRADGEFRRKVAIKIVKRGVDTDFVLRRFRNERQILAELDHPYITRLIDGGTTDDGRPYFVMDYIDGLPLYRFADKNALSINERLKLFVRIGEAVEYAHQKRVIHRDLKPSNILVTSEATPRLLDFGIAKLLDPEMSFDTLQPTATALRMMTIDYASPEQVRGEKVDFTTDVYSLGVVLYELLTGYRPYQIRGRASHEIAKAICDDEPPLPSDVVSGTIEAVAVPVSRSATTLVGSVEIYNNHENELRGNLDNIVMKALEKEPEKRYQSVADFCVDIERHLKGETADALQYSSRKRTATARSNNDDTELLAVLPLKLLNFSATDDTDENYLGIGLADAIISRLTSVREFTVRPTSSISGYEKSDVDPLQAGRELGVDFVLDGRIKKFGETLRISLQMLDVQKGSTTWAGQFDEKFSNVLALEDAISEQVAEALISQNTGENRLELGKRGTDNAQAYDAYLRGRYFWNQFTPETFPKALAAFEHAIELDPNYALAHVGIADYYNWATIFGFYAPLEGYHKTREAALRALEINPQLSEAISVLAFITAFTDYDWAEAEKLFKQSLEINPNYGLTHEWYSALLAGTGRDEEAYKEILRSLELDPLSLRTVTLTAWTLYQLRRYPEALAKVEELFEMNPTYYQAFFQRGNILIELGRAEEAVTAARKGIELAPGLGYLHSTLCFALASLNRYEEAWEVLKEYEANSPATEMNSYHLGMCYAAVGESETAFKWFNKAVDDRHPWVVWLATDAKLDNFRDDDRFNELLRKSNRSHLVKKSVENEKQSIAVLPLQFIGEIETGDDYLSVGLADAMITRLSQVRRIIVRPTNSVLRFAGTQDSFGAGGELGVDYVLSGMIRPAGKRIRISAQLLDVKTNTTLWSEKFDEEFIEVLELEDKVAEKVAKLLIPQLTAEEEQNLAKRNVGNVEAYEAYMRGRYHLNLFTPDNYAKAYEYFQEAIRLDPDYALAYASLAEYYFALGTFGNIRPRESYRLAQEMARHAIELDDKLGEAYSILGFTQLTEFELQRADETFRRAISLNPNYPLAHVFYSVLLVVLKENDRAISEAVRAIELNPRAPFEKNHLMWILYQTGLVTEAAKMTKEIACEFPDFGHNLGSGSWVLRSVGELDTSLEFARRAVQVSPDTPWLTCNLAATYAKLGKLDKAVKLLRKIESSPDSAQSSPYAQAIAYLSIGDKETAFARLDLAYETRDAWVAWLASDAETEPLRDDPRYLELIQKIYPLQKTDETIHQSQIPTKTFAADELKGAKSEERKYETKVDGPKPGFFYRHRFKFATVAVLSVLAIIAYATGIMTVRFDSDGKGLALETVDSKTPRRSVAVLPFKNFTGTPEGEALSDKLTLDLFDRLLATGANVAPLSASTRYQNTELSHQEIGAELNVDAIVAGTLTRNQDAIVVIQVTVFASGSGAKLASVTYEGKMDEMAIIQEKLRGSVAQIIAQMP